MKRLIILCAFFYTIMAYGEYYNFIIDENVQNQRVDWTGSGSYFRGTNEFLVAELDMHESIEIDFISHLNSNPPSSSFNFQGPGSLSGYWYNGGSGWRFILRYNDEKIIPQYPM